LQQTIALGGGIARSHQRGLEATLATTLAPSGGKPAAWRKIDGVAAGVCGWRRKAKRPLFSALPSMAFLGSALAQHLPAARRTDDFGGGWTPPAFDSFMAAVGDATGRGGGFVACEANESQLVDIANLFAIQ
jgi:hypothetical protein